MTTQDSDTRPVRLVAPEGIGPFLVARFGGSEGLGRLYEYDLVLLSTDTAIDFNKVMAQPMALVIAADGDRPERIVHGFVSRFSQTEPRGRHMEYLATIVPFVWFLTRTADCRIFQGQTVPEIVRKVLSDRGFDDVEDRLVTTYPPWEYCVQYRETDFNFISRLLEHEGIYYFFQHSLDETGRFKHVMVLCDDPANHKPGQGCAALPFGTFLSTVPVETITDWSVMNHVHSDDVTLADFNFKKPKTGLVARQINLSDNQATPPSSVFDYPAGFTEAKQGERLAAVRADQITMRRTVFRGTTDARGLFAGVQFGLEGHPRQDQNANYLVISSSHSGSSDVGDTVASGGRASDSGDLYSCSFEAIQTHVTYRPARITPKPLIQGPQTAMVVGPSGEEIHTDEFGRVRVLFHWDHAGDPSKGNTSCFIRVAQVWAGKKWGGMFIPRVGQEVIVEFLEGDPDQPIITGRVYNGDAKPPYTLPAEATKSTIKSSTSKGGAGFNELRFEDKKGEEQVFIHAEKNLDIRVKADAMHTMGGGLHTTVGGDQRTKVAGDRHLKLEGDDLAETAGDTGVAITGDRKSKVDGNDERTVGGDDLVKVTGDMGLTVGGDLAAKSSGAFSVDAGGDLQQKVGMNAALEAGMEIHLKAGMKVIIEAGVQLTLKVGGNFVDISPAGVAITGTMVMINSGGAAGSGSGCSPLAPAEPAAPDAPEDPAAAANAEAGGNTEIPAAHAPSEQTTFSPEALKLKTAAENGTPFCEECEAAKARAAARSQ